LVGGLYCVSLGRAVFGESMFSERSDGSKIALSALVAFCMHHQITQIDCQQNTRHLASLGAAPIPRAEFVASLRQTTQSAAPNWTFLPEYWELLL
jgi:leucyl/phenylalanyl-tRNA--protein transferase